jgi:hypothetical protein
VAAVHSILTMCELNRVLCAGRGHAHRLTPDVLPWRAWALEPPALADSGAQSHERKFLRGKRWQIREHSGERIAGGTEP